MSAKTQMETFAERFAAHAKLAKEIAELALADIDDALHTAVEPGKVDSSKAELDTTSTQYLDILSVIDTTLAGLVTIQPAVAI